MKKPDKFQVVEVLIRHNKLRIMVDSVLRDGYCFLRKSYRNEKINFGNFIIFSIYLQFTTTRKYVCVSIRWWPSEIYIVTDATRKSQNPCLTSRYTRLGKLQNSFKTVQDIKKKSYEYIDRRQKEFYDDIFTRPTTKRLGNIKTYYVLE